MPELSHWMLPRPLYYLLDGHTPVPTDDLEAVEHLLRDAAPRRVAETQVTETLWVSTVFVMIDHQYGDGPPLLFETMVFGLPDDEEICQRYATWDDAEAGHHAVVARLQREAGPAPLPGHLCEVCLEAPACLVQPAPWGGEMGVCARCAATQRHASAP